MDTALLATKVRVPPQPHHLVHRSRLIDALERGIPEYKLIRIAGSPAGLVPVREDAALVDATGQTWPVRTSAA
jgi:hypothetical protein